MEENETGSLDLPHDSILTIEKEGNEEKESNLQEVTKDPVIVVVEQETTSPKTMDEAQNGEGGEWKWYEVSPSKMGRQSDKHVEEDVLTTPSRFSVLQAN